MNEYENIEIAREALYKMLPGIVERVRGELGPEDAYYYAVGELEGNDNFSEEQKMHIICSALMVVFSHGEHGHSLHPYSGLGYDLMQVIGSAVYGVYLNAERRGEIKEDSITWPDWV